MKTLSTTTQMKIQKARQLALAGSTALGFLLVLLVLSLVFPYSSKAQTITEEVVTGQETSPNYLPGMEDFTTSGGTKHNTGTGTSQGCLSGNFCTAGKQGPGGTYTSTFDLEDNMTIDQINRGFDMDYSTNVTSHVSNSRLASCVNGNVMQASDCRDIFSLTVSLFDAGNALKHKFEHEVELDFSGTRNFAFNQTIPQNTYSELTGTFELFGIDAGFGSKFFGPAFSNPSLTTTFDLVTLIETEIIDVINNEVITDTQVDVTPDDIATVEVEIQTPDGQQMASLEIEVETQMEIPNVELAPPPPPAETSTPEPEVQEVEAEFNTEQSSEAAEPQQTQSEPEPEPEQTAEAEPEPEPEPENSGNAESEPDPDPEQETQPAEAEPEAEEQQQQTSSKPKPKKVASKKNAKQKVARKIMKKMGDKGRYDSSNQLKTLVVMTVLGNSRGFFDSQVTLPDAAQFYQPTAIPGGEISDNALGGFMFNDSAAGHNSLVDMQYR